MIRLFQASYTATGAGGKWKTEIADGMQLDRFMAGPWSHANAETLPSMSAVGYSFGDALQKEVGVPIGLIDLADGRLYLNTRDQHGSSDSTRAHCWSSNGGESLRSKFAEVPSLSVPVWSALRSQRLRRHSLQAFFLASLRNCQQKYCMRGRWNGPFHKFPFRSVERLPSRCR